jgi:two-component system, cell cycle response regulator
MELTIASPALSWPRTAAVRVWATVALVGYAFLVAHFAVGLGGRGLDHFADRWVSDGLELLAAAGCLLRVISSPVERPAWAALGIGILAFAIGDICFDFVYGGNPPSVSAADVFYLAFYPCCYAALALLVRSRISSFDRSVWLDGGIAALAATAVSASIVLEVVIRSAHGGAETVIVDLAYPVADLVLLAIVIFVFVITARLPGRAWLVAGVAFGVITLADSLFLYLNATGGYAEGTMLDALWPGAMLLLAFVAWQPAEGGKAVALEGRFLLTPLVCGLAALGVLVASRFEHLNLVAGILAAAAILAVFARTGLSLRDNAWLLERTRTQSHTDELTGLANRRSLMLMLGRELRREAVQPLVFAIFDLNGFKRYNDTFGHPSGDALLARLAGRLARSVGSGGHAFRLGGDEFCLLVPSDRAGVPGVLERGLAALSEEGEGFSISAEVGSVVLPDEATDPTGALRLADERLYLEKYRLYQGAGDSHEVLLQVLDTREPGLRERMRVVAELAAALGAECGLAGPRLDELRLAAELHDVGKLAVPVTVLEKAGPLSEEEWSFIRQHPVVGQRVISAAPSMRSVGLIVRATHERYDGRGYLDGLAGDAIPLGARIIAVCDAYAAMTDDRPYRAALSRAEALTELRRCAGTQFDPAIVTAFCRHAEGAARLRPARRGAADPGRSAPARPVAPAGRS